MAGDLEVSLIIRVLNRATAPIRRITRDFEHMKKGMDRFKKASRIAADVRQAAEGVNTFARKARGFISTPIDAAIKFQAEMSRVKGLTKTSGDDFEELRNKALELGASIGEFSALEVAKGMSELGIAGFNNLQIMQALPKALDLSTAAQTELAETLKITTGMLGGFSLEADQTGRISDVLAATMTGSKTTLQSLGETLGYAAPVAKNLGVTFEQTAIMAGLLGNANIDASRAGTVLNAMLTRLAAPRRLGKSYLQALKIDIEEIVDGVKKMRAPVAILNDIARATETLSNTKRAEVLSRIFGLEAAAGVTKLISSLGSVKMEKLTSDVMGSKGALDTLAATMRDNTANSVRETSSAIDTMNISIGEQLLPGYTALTTTVGSVARKFNEWATTFPRLTKWIFITVGITALLATVLGGMLFTVAALTSGVGFIGLMLGVKMTGKEMMVAAVRGAARLIKQFFVMAGRAIPQLLISLKLTLIHFAKLTALLVFQTITAIGATIAAIAKFSLALLASPMFWFVALLVTLGVVIAGLALKWDPVLKALDWMHEKINKLLEPMQSLNAAIQEKLPAFLGGTAVPEAFEARADLAQRAGDLATKRFQRKSQGLPEDPALEREFQAAREALRSARAGAPTTQGGTQEIGGVLEVKVSDDRVRIGRLESRGPLELAVDTGIMP